MDESQRIALNLFPLQQQDFSFQVFRTPCIQNDPQPDSECSRHTFREDSDSTAGPYWLCFSPKAGFSPFTCRSSDYPAITCRFLFHVLRTACVRSLSPDTFSVEDSFLRRVSFVLQQYSQGDATVWLSPYQLHVKRVFGFLADFRFRRRSGVPFDRDILRLSLSLDRQYKENRNFYADRYQQLQLFIRTYHAKLFPIRINDQCELDIRPSLLPVSSESLATKAYLFAGERPSSSQFLGVKQFGPLTAAPPDARLCFMYRPHDKPYSYDLYRALRGDTFATFTGMEAMFRFRLTQDHVIGLPVNDFEPLHLEAAVLELKTKAPGSHIVPVLLVPWSRHDVDRNPDDDYYRSKHVFLRHCLPSQYVSLKTLQNKEVLKWSASNIALALFAKLGGQPWKVKPSHADCLIVGIGQSHKRSPDGAITRYYAYSVLTDSSGLYEDLRVLSKDSSESTYLTRLTESLVGVFAEHASRFSRFAIHTTFSLRKTEMKAINEAITSYRQAASSATEFVVLKFNDDSKFFGYSQTANSMVPFESTFVPLGRGEYTVWFEGLQYHKPNVMGRVAKPMHIQFAYPSEPPLTTDQQRAYLQDALNLSGANWRGFNAKTLPVSVYYAHLIARYFNEFDRLGLAEVDLESLTPWFL
jgi:hypothetical protein